MIARVLLVGPPDKPFAELKDELTQAGFVTETAIDGTEALEAGGWFQPHLVVIEVQLSGISGFELSSRICHDEAGFGAKVVFYTGCYRDEKSRQVVNSKYGALGYFVKPFQKQALLKCIDDALRGIDAEAGRQGSGQGNAVLPSFQKPGTTAQDEFLENPPKPEPLSHEPRVVETRNNPIDSQCLSLVLRSRELAAGGRLLDSSLARQSESQWQTAKAPLQEIPTRICSTHKTRPHSELKIGPFPHSSPDDQKEDRSSPLRNEISEVTVLQISNESQGAALPKTLSTRAKMLAVAAVAIVALGLSLSLLPSSSPFPEASRQSSFPPPPSKNQIPSLNSGVSETPAFVTPEHSSGPQDPGDAASEAMIRLLRPSASAFSEPADKTTSPVVPIRQRARQDSTGSPGLVIRDVSPMESQPLLTTEVHPLLSVSEIRAMGSESFLVGLELNQDGTVIDARLLTPDPKGSFPTKILDAARRWRFIPKEKAERGSWVKYFTFKAPPPLP